MWNAKAKIDYILYSITAKWLPESSHSSFAKKARGFWARHIIREMGKNVNVERGARFTPELSIGNDSGLGIRSEIYGPVIIGECVMMGPEVVIYTQNHKHELGTPFGQQGYEISPVTIGNNVWIGRRVMFMAGSSIGNNSVVGAGAVVTKQFGDGVIVGGVPAKIIGHVKKEEV